MAAKFGAFLNANLIPCFIRASSVAFSFGDNRTPDSLTHQTLKTLFLYREQPTPLTIGLRAAITFALMFAACLVYTLVMNRFHRPPAPTSDGVDYHNLAVSLSQGEGYTHNWSDPQRKRAYEQANASGEYALILAQSGGGPTTKRPPGYPAVLAAIYTVGGPWFGWSRIANSLFTAVAVALATAYAEKHGGALLAIIAAGSMLATDWLLVWHASLVMAESLAALLVVLLLLAAASAVKKPSIGIGVLIGLLLAFLILVRASMLLWLPCIVVGGIACCWRRRCEFVAEDAAIRKYARSAATCFAIAMVISLATLTPWWIRNCRATGRFTPLGVLGSQSLAGAYNNAALADWGNWKFEDDSFRLAKRRPEFNTASFAEREYLIGEESKRLALTWVRENYAYLPLMWLGRLAVLFHIGNVADLIRLLLLPIGVVVVSKWPGGRFVLLAIAVNALVVSLTWSHNGRFLAPVRPLMHIVAAAGVVWLISSLVRAVRARYERPERIPGIASK